MNTTTENEKGYRTIYEMTESEFIDYLIIVKGYSKESAEFVAKLYF